MEKIIITGASEGIGEAIALSLASPETELVLVARNEVRLQEVALAIESKGGVATVQVVDLMDRAAIINFAQSIDAVDVLINNAGVWQKMQQLDELSDEDVLSVLETNLTGHILLTKHLLPKLRQSDHPRLLNIISKSGVTAQDGQSVYTASKWGMKGFTDVLRNDLKDARIRVGAIYQSGTATDMFAKTGEEVPKEKFTDPDDLAQVVKFMLNQPDKIWLNEVHVAY